RGDLNDRRRRRKVRGCANPAGVRTGEARPMIEVEQLTRRFALPGGGEVLAVDRLSFHVASGEVYGLLGPNGAGKTTTLRMLLGLLRPTEGHAAIAGFRS